LNLSDKIVFITNIKARAFYVAILILIAGVSLTTYFVIARQKTQVTPESATNSPAAEGLEPASFTIDSNFTAHVFASDLGKPRVLTFSPGGTLLTSNPSGDNVYALPDKDGNGVADQAKIIIKGEGNVHGLAFYQGQLYIADVDKVVRYIWDESGLTATRDKVLFELPKNSNHNNRSVVFNDSGKMFISIGSTCNVCRESPESGGSVWQSDFSGASPQVFAMGLRNAAFLAINPVTYELWATEMGRDFLGDDLPPDEINIVRQGENYGWPYCYGKGVHDENFDPANSSTCNNTTSPVYEIPAHSAPLGIVFINSPQFPESWQGDLLVSYHGSWNRSVPTGYKVVHLNVSGNSITDSSDFITNISPAGRPVGLTFDNLGNLLLSDDKGGKIYMIEAKSRQMP